MRITIDEPSTESSNRQQISLTSKLRQRLQPAEMLMFDQLVRQYIVVLRAFHLHMQDAHLAQGIAGGGPCVARAVMCGHKKAPLNETHAAKINKLVTEAVPDGEEERLWAAKERAREIATDVRPLRAKAYRRLLFK